MQLVVGPVSSLLISHLLRAVLGVRHWLEPDNVNALRIGFLEREVHHGVLRAGTVPVPLMGSDDDGVAGVNLLHGLACQLNQPRS